MIWPTAGDLPSSLNLAPYLISAAERAPDEFSRNSAEGVRTMRLSPEDSTSTADFAAATGAVEPFPPCLPQPTKGNPHIDRAMTAPQTTLGSRFKRFIGRFSGRIVAPLFIAARFSDFGSFGATCG